MKHFDQNALCACGSGVRGEFCCLVAAPPVSVDPIGFNNLKLEISGVDVYGREVPVPPELSSTISLNNPNQLSREVTELMNELLVITEPHVRDFEHGKKLGELLTNLADALEAVRYHQRQFLARYRIVQNHYGKSDVTGSAQIQIVFNDRPLQCEFEAVVIRTRTVLDSAAHIALFLYGQAPDKFGALCNLLKKNARRFINGHNALKLIEDNKTWVLSDRAYRDSIVHQGQLRSFQGLKIGVHGIDVARVEKDDTVQYCLEVWPKIITFTRKLLLLTSGSRSEKSPAE
jgi:hypothetical protein